MGAIDSLKSSISEFIKTGKMDIEGLGESILGVFADVVADKATKELMTMLGQKDGSWLSNLFGDLGFASQGDEDLSAAQAMLAGSTQAGSTIGSSMVTAGGQVAAQIQNAMLTGATIARGQVQSGLTTGGTMAGVRLQTSASQGGNALAQGAVQGAPILAQGVAAGAAGGGAGGGFLSGLGGWGGLAGMILPGLFSEGGYSNAPVATAALPAALFYDAPHFKSGGISDGGIPAVLHPNEAVIPLTRGRKIGVELNGEEAAGSAGRAMQAIHITQNIQTPSPDAFRRSQKQLASEMGIATQRAMKANN